MREGYMKNDAGLWEVWHTGNMVARVHSEADALEEYTKARGKTLDRIDELRERLNRRHGSR